MKKIKDTIECYNELAEGYDKDYYRKNPKVWANIVRVRLILKRLKQLGCKTVVDCGCGSGEPTKIFLENGLDAYGFDISPKMVEVSRNKIEHKRIELADLEKTIPFKNIKFDAMMMHGPLMHCMNETRLLNNANKMLKKGGVLLCEARNELMSLFSMNHYSKDFFLKMVEADKLPNKMRKDVIKYYSTLNIGKGKTWDHKIMTRFYNPFTIHKLFESCGFKIRKLHFAHYHCLPPIFEKKYPEQYKELSLKMENPDDWRGYFMASTFLVEAYKL